jgi:hypothetical protein
MRERNVFEALKVWLTNKGLTFRQLFWLTGFLAFFISPIADNLKEVQVDINTDVDRCNKSMLANIEVHVPGNGICVDNKNPYSPAC